MDEIRFTPNNALKLQQQYGATPEDLHAFEQRGFMSFAEADAIRNRGAVSSASTQEGFTPFNSFTSGVVPGTAGDIAGTATKLIADRIPVVGPAISPFAQYVAGAYGANAMSPNPASTPELISGMTDPQNLVKTGAAIGTGLGVGALGLSTLPAIATGWAATSAAPVLAEAAMDTGKWLMGYPDENNSTLSSYGNEFFSNLGGGLFGAGRQGATKALGAGASSFSRQFDQENSDAVRSADIERVKSYAGINPELFDEEAGKRILHAIGAGPGTSQMAQELKSSRSAKGLLPVLTKYVMKPLQGLLANQDPQTAWEALPKVLEAQLSENGPILGARDAIRSGYDLEIPTVDASTGSNLKNFIAKAEAGILTGIERVVDPVTKQVSLVKVKSPSKLNSFFGGTPEYGYAVPIEEAKKYLQSLFVSGKSVGELHQELKSLDKTIQDKKGYNLNNRGAEARMGANDPRQNMSLQVLQAARRDLADHITSVMTPNDAAIYTKLGSEYGKLRSFQNQYERVAPTLQVTDTTGGLIERGEMPGATSRTMIRNVADMISSAGDERRSANEASNLKNRMSEGGRRARTLLNTLLALNGDPSAFPEAGKPALPGERYLGGLVGAGIGGMLGGALGTPLLGGGGAALGGVIGYEAAPYLANGPLKTAYNVGATPQTPYTAAGIQQGVRGGAPVPEAMAMPPGLRAPNGMSMAGIDPDAMELAQMQTQMQMSPTTDPKAMNAILSAIMPPRDFSNGLPRDSGQWDPKAIYQFISSVVPTGDPRAPMAKVLVSKLLSATQQGDETEKRKILTDMSRTFPDLFEPGMGIDNLLLHPEDQKKYISSMKNGLYAGTVDSHLLTQQLQRFSNPEDGGMVPYRAPIANTIRSGALLTNVTPRKIDYDY